MSVIAVSRWQINRDEARRILRDSAAQIREAGGQRIELCRVSTGPNVGQIIVAVHYENHEAVGRATQALHNNQQYQQHLAEATKIGQLLDRTFLEVEEIT
jgi:hypothetical protein